MISRLIFLGFLSLPLQAQTVTFNGTGCPQGHGADYAIHGDILQLTFPAEFSAESYPNSPLSQGRKNCIATVVFPDKYQTYAIESLGFSAFADLPRDVKATIGVSYFYEGQIFTGAVDFNQQGPFAGDWILDPESIPFYKQIWKPCGLDRALNINSKVSVTKSSTVSAIAQLRTLAVKIKRRACINLGI